MSTKGRVYWGMYFSAQPNSRNYLFLFMLDSSTSSILIPYWIIPPLHLLSNTLSWHRLFHLSWIICITDANMTFKPSTNGFTELAHILKWALPLKGRSWAAHHTYYSQGADLLFLIKSRLLLLLLWSLYGWWSPTLFKLLQTDFHILVSRHHLYISPLSFQLLWPSLLMGILWSFNVFSTAGSWYSF